MNCIYYLFSKSDKLKSPLETLYMCVNGNYINKPSYKTKIYPMGTLLSRTITLLTPWYETNFNWYKQQEYLFKFTNKHKTKETSFPKSAENDRVFIAAFKTLFSGEPYIQTNKNYDQMIKFLHDYMNFISLCYKNNKLCASINLNFLANQNGCIMPQYNLFTDELITSNGKLSKDDINDMLSGNDNLGYSFDPDFARSAKKIFKLDDNFETENNETLITPIYVFQIHDIVDLILASLQCIFEKNYFIGKCNYCKELYVTNKRNIRYCPQKNNLNTNCQKLEKARRQLIKNSSSQNKKMYNSIRTMLGNKYGYGEDGNAETPYNIFCTENQEWQNKIKTGETTLREYEEWLKSHYKRKYKK